MRLLEGLRRDGAGFLLQRQRTRPAERFCTALAGSTGSPRSPVQNSALSSAGALPWPSLPVMTFPSARLEELSGIPLRAAFEDPALPPDVKGQAKYARQNGIHVMPTFMVDGLVCRT